MIDKILPRYAVVARFFYGAPTPISHSHLFHVVALFFLSLLLFTSPLLEGGTTHLAALLNRLLILCIFLVFLARHLMTEAFTTGICRTDIGLTVLTYLGLAAVSTIYSSYLNQSLQWLIILFSYAVVLYVLATSVLSWDDIAKLLKVLILVGLLETGLGVIQGLWLRVLRPNGTFFNPNFLAGYLVSGWSVLLGYLCFTIGKNSWRKWKKGLFSWIHIAAPVLIMVLFVGAILWTGSRGAILALLVGAALIIAVRFGFKGLTVLILFMACSLLLPSPFRERLYAEHTQNPLAYARLQIWKSTVHEIIDYPFGIGIGLSQYVYPRYALPVEGQITRYGQVAQTAHNEYLQMTAELGIVSLFTFAFGVILVARDTELILKQRLRRWQRGLIVGIAGSIASLLIHAAFDSNLHEPALAIVLTLFVGIIISVRRSYEQTTTLQRIFPMRLRILLFAVVIVMVGIVGVCVVRLGLAWMAYEAGSRALQNREISVAIKRYESAVALDYGKALYHSSLGAAHFRAFAQTDNSKAAKIAIDELQIAMKLNPLDGRLPGLLGHVYVSLSTAISKEKSSKDSADQQQRSWLQAARVAYQRAIELEPFSAFYLLELAKVYDALSDREAAEAYAKRAIETEPNFLPGRQWLATIYFQSGRTIEADREYQEIRERQQRYANWDKDAIESSFLTADVASR